MVIKIDDYYSLFETLNHDAKIIGSGAEGVAFKTGSNVTKMLYDTSFIDSSRKIITSEDYNLESYIFPDKVLFYNNKYVGFISKYFENDIFKNSKRCLTENEIYNLLKAREKILKDTEKLSDDRIYLLDLEENILFDGERLAVIDTTCYRKCNFDTEEDNIEGIDYAILRALESNNRGFRRSRDLSFEENVKEYQKTICR